MQRWMLVLIWIGAAGGTYAAWQLRHDLGPSYMVLFGVLLVSTLLRAWSDYGRKKDDDRAPPPLN